MGYGLPEWLGDVAPPSWVSPEQALQLQDMGKAILVDCRDPVGMGNGAGHAEGAPEGSFNIPAAETMMFPDKVSAYQSLGIGFLWVWVCFLLCRSSKINYLASLQHCGTRVKYNWVRMLHFRLTEISNSMQVCSEKHLWRFFDWILHKFTSVQEILQNLFWSLDEFWCVIYIFLLFRRSLNCILA